MLLLVIERNASLYGLLFALLGAAGFTAAALKAGRIARFRPTLAGTAAAVAAFVLTLPLRLMVHDQVFGLQTAISIGYALVVGTIGGALAARQAARRVSTADASPARPRLPRRP
jgi:drug/metabolite transporter (DMT)-like permease